MAKTKVAVLGGGVGGIVAAMQLTATPELRQRYEVTVHQLGWRLGGKGASGRNGHAAQRIEEHGLHLWFGFYDNAFRVMKQAYAELGRVPGTDPLATFDEAFRGMDTIALYDREGTGWRGMAMTWPANGGSPGDGRALPGFWDLVVTAGGLFEQSWAGLVKANPSLGLPVQGLAIPGWLDPLAKLMGATVDGYLQKIIAFANFQAAAQLWPFPLPYGAEQSLVLALNGLREVAWLAVEPYERRDARVRLFFTCLDTMIATVDGLVTDGVLDAPEGLDLINGKDLTGWLGDHGLTALTKGATPADRAPMLRALYDVAFGYVGGDIGKPDIAAGTAVNDLLRLVFTFRGHLAYKMQAGMGDVVFMPFYEVLRKRKVKFEFFSAVEKLHVDPSSNRVDRIDVVKQVELAGTKAYDPRVTVGGLPCWPSAPKWKHLKDGAVHEAAGVDFEASANPLGRPVTTLHRGTDFDEVVLGISVGGLPGIVDELSARDKTFARAMNTAVTVRTQAFQLWLGDATDALGYPFGPGSVAGCFVEPLDTYCDMTHLVEREKWPVGAVGSIAYFCGVLDHRNETHEEATARVRAGMEAFLEHDIQGLWPDAVTAGAVRHLQWNKLACPGAIGASATGKARLDHQYWRANTAGSELYVLTPAGTVKDRLPSGDTGFSNLVAAGDWTRNGIDGGCVEAAAVSGIDAANAIIARHLQPGDPAPVPPTNADTTWLGGP